MTERGMDDEEVKEVGGATKANSGASRDEGGPMRRLMSCIGGVGGVSITIWLLFFVFLEPYDPSKSPCTQLGSVEDLRGSLKLIDAATVDWKQFGKNLGLSGGQLESLSLEEVGEDAAERVDSVLRTWYASRNRACWEAVVKALVKMGETKNAKQLVDAYRLKVNVK